MLFRSLVALVDGGGRPGARSYRHRTLREHVYGSPTKQRLASLACRLDGLMWKLGFR